MYGVTLPGVCPRYLPAVELSEYFEYRGLLLA